MAETKTATPKKDTSEKKQSFAKGLKGEFKKIIWPTKDTLTKQTVAVVAISIALGIIISVIDTALQFGINFIVK